jgi:hypothetical protein
MADEVEVFVNTDNEVMITIAAMSAAPVGYRILDHRSMTFELVCDDGSRYPRSFPADARQGWQLVIDTEKLLVTEVDTVSGDPVIVRDEWLAPEVT